MIKILSGLLVVASAAYGVTRFEAEEGFLRGQPIDNVKGWKGSAMISEEEAYSYEQSLEVTAERSAEMQLSGQVFPISYFDVWIKPAADDSEEPYTTLDFGGAKLAFLGEEDGGRFYAYSSQDGEDGSTPLSGSYALNLNNVSEKWIRLTVRRDGNKGVCDIFLDGFPVVMGLKVEGSGKQIGFQSSQAGPCFVDDLEVSGENPLFKDTDNDGIPDAYEVIRGMNPNFDDREGDVDLDGEANIEEFARFMMTGKSEGGSGGAQAANVIYVDKRSGSDKNSGRFCYPVAGDGPKASVRSAIAGAKAGDTIAVIEGDYYEGDIFLAGEPINFTTIGKVRFK